MTQNTWQKRATQTLDNHGRRLRHLEGLDKTVAGGGDGGDGGGATFGGSPLPVSPDVVLSPGVSGFAARVDHEHSAPTAAPFSPSVNLGASQVGIADSFARSDHTHQLDTDISPTWTSPHTFTEDIEIWDSHDLRVYSDSGSTVVATIDGSEGWYRVDHDLATDPLILDVAGTYLLQIDVSEETFKFTHGIYIQDGNFGFHIAQPDSEFHVWMDDNTTGFVMLDRYYTVDNSSIQEVLRLGRYGSGAGVAGIGTKLTFYTEDGGSNDEQIGELAYVLTNVGVGTEEGRLDIGIVSSGAVANRLQLTSTTLEFQQAHTITATGNLTLELDATGEVMTFTSPGGSTEADGFVFNTYADIASENSTWMNWDAVWAPTGGLSIERQYFVHWDFDVNQSGGVARYTGFRMHITETDARGNANVAFEVRVDSTNIFQLEPDGNAWFSGPVRLASAPTSMIHCTTGDVQIQASGGDLILNDTRLYLPGSAQPKIWTASYDLKLQTGTGIIMLQRSSTGDMIVEIGNQDVTASQMAGALYFRAWDSVNAEQRYSGLKGHIVDPLSTSVDGRLSLWTWIDNTETEIVRIEDDIIFYYETIHEVQLQIKGIAAPGAGPAGYGHFYAKTDGGLYWHYAGGSEVDLTVGGGGGAPVGESYVVMALSGTLTAERRLQGTANQITLTDGGANGDATLSLPTDINLSGASTIGTATGDLVLDPAGDIELKPGGSDVRVIPATAQLADLYLDADLESGAFARLLFRGHNTTPADVVYAYLSATITNATPASEDGEFNLYTMQDGSSNLTFTWGGGETAAFFQMRSQNNQANDQIGLIQFIGRDAVPGTQTYAYIRGYIEDPTSTQEDGQLRFSTFVAGSEVERIRLDATDIKFYDDLTFQQASTIGTSTGDLRIEPAGDVGIGAAADSTYKLWVEGTIGGQFLRLVSASPQMRWYDTDGSDPDDYFYMIYNSELVSFWWRDDSGASWVKFFDLDPAGDIDVYQDLTFQQSSTISNTTGNLAVSAAGDLDLYALGNDMWLRPSTGNYLDVYFDTDVTASWISRLIFRAHNLTPANIDYAQIVGRILDATAGNEGGAIDFYMYDAGTSALSWRFAGGYDKVTTINFFNQQNVATDVIGRLAFLGYNSTPASHEYARISVHIADPTATQEDGQIYLQVYEAGSIDNFLSVKGGAGILAYKDLTFPQPAIISTSSGDLTLSPASQVLFPDGSVSSPSISFTSDPNSGIFWIAADRYSFAAQGTGIMEVRYDATYRHVRIKGGDWAGGSINTSTLYMTVGSQSVSHLIDETNGVYAIESWLSGTGNDYPIVLNYFGGDVGIGVVPKTKLTIEGALTLKEQAAADSSTAAYGQIWVKDDAPNTLYFTTDTGVDYNLLAAQGGIDDLDDVTITSAADGQTLFYENSSSQWKNTSLILQKPATNLVTISGDVGINASATDDRSLYVYKNETRIDTDYQNVWSYYSISPTAATTRNYYAIWGRTVYNGGFDHTGGSILGVAGVAQNASTDTVYLGVGTSGSIYSTAAGVITTGRIFWAIAPWITAGSITNLIGLYVDAIDDGTSTNYSIYTNAGDLSLGDDIVFRQASTISTTTGDMRLDSAGVLYLEHFTSSRVEVTTTASQNVATLRIQSQGNSSYFVDHIIDWSDYTYQIEVDGNIIIQTKGYNTPEIVSIYTYQGASAAEAFRVQDDSAGVGASLPGTLDGTFHVHAATAGSVTANANADLIVAETTTSGGISILTGNAGAGRLWYGTPSDNDYHGLDMFGSSHATKAGIMGLVVAGSRRVEFTTTEMQFLQAQTISTSTGDLTLAPTSSLLVTPGSNTVTIAATTGNFPYILFDTDRNSAFQAVGAVQFRGHDSGAANTVYARIDGVIGSPTAGSETGRIYFYTTDGGTNKLTMSLLGGTTTAATEFRLYSEVSAATPVGIQFYGDDSGGAASPYAGIGAYIVDNTATQEDGRLDFNVTINGTLTKMLELDDGSTAYQQAQTISTTSGNLTVDSAGYTILRDNTIVGPTLTTPDGTLHVHTATAGSVAASGDADDLVVENSAHGGISILTPANQTGFVVFGAPSASTDGWIGYDHSADELQLAAGGASRATLSSTAFEFQQATTITTSTGNITLDPAGDFYIDSTCNVYIDSWVYWRNSADTTDTFRFHASASEHVIDAYFDNVEKGYLRFQSDGDVILQGDGDVRIDNTNVIIGSSTLSPDGTLHVYTASAGTVTASADGDDLVVEWSTGDGGISVLTADANWGNLVFGSASDNKYAWVGAKYNDSNLAIVGPTSGTITMGLDSGATVVTVGVGVQIGSPTGGDKGAGTINVDTDIYKDDSAYANPDYVLEHYYRGSIVEFADNPGAAEYLGFMPLEVTAEFMRANLHLPWINNEDPSGAFDRFDQLLVGQETVMLHILELEERVRELEKIVQGEDHAIT